MPLSSEAQALFDHAKQSLPRWLTGGSSSALEWMYSFTEIFDDVRVQGQDWLDITLLDISTGVELDQHALDRGTSRRASETDAALRERLRQITDALTEPALFDGVDAILDGAGSLAQFRVQAYTSSGWNSVFEANDTIVAGGWQTGIYLSVVNNGTNPPTATSVASADNTRLDVTINYSAGVTTRAALEALVGPTIGSFRLATASSSGASVLVAGDAFSNKRFYLSGLVSLRRDRGHFHTDGTCRAFFNRGYRMCNVDRPMGYIFILPFGTTAATANAVSEYLRKNGAGGFIYYAERRLIP